MSPEERAALVERVAKVMRATVHVTATQWQFTYAEAARAAVDALAPELTRPCPHIVTAPTGRDRDLLVDRLSFVIGKRLGERIRDDAVEAAVDEFFGWLAEREGSEPEFVQVGTWLLPERYGDQYDHFTQTRMGTLPGNYIAVYAKREDVAEREAGRG